MGVRTRKLRAPSVEFLAVRLDAKCDHGVILRDGFGAVHRIEKAPEMG